MTWRDRYRPATFRGIEFKVDTGARAGGRRGINFEFPKRNKPSDEDMGRRSKRLAITGYLIGPDHDLDANLLEDALNAEGPGQLILMGEELSVRADVYTRSERKDQMNMTMFDMTFVEAGESAADLATEATQQNLRTKADDAASKLGAQSQANAETVSL